MRAEDLVCNQELVLNQSQSLAVIRQLLQARGIQRHRAASWIGNCQGNMSGKHRTDRAQFRPLTKALCLAFALNLPTSALLASEAMPCDGGMVAVQAPNTDLQGHLCEAAPRIVTQLGHCGLIQTRPLRIDVVDELSHEIGNCLAWFDCDQDTIKVTDPSRYGDVIEKGSPYAGLPADVLLESALTHELAHALISQTAAHREVSLIDHEYIAAALELELMDPDWRNVLLSSAPVSLPPKTGLIDIWIYGLAPRKFATNAWQHFSLPENGCALVRRIVEGEATLSDLSR